MPETMTDIYAWTEEHPEGGEGVIAAIIPAMGPNLVTLQSRRRDIADKMRVIALQHMLRSGHRVRLVRFARAEDIETITPKV